MKILILCTGNTCRSQMAEGWLRHLDPNLVVRSAGTDPGDGPNPLAVKVMQEIGIDISGGSSDNVDKFLNEKWDHVITVCDHARETCPVFPGPVGSRFHIGFDDPAEAQGSDDEVLAVYRRVRDEIRRDFSDYFAREVTKQR